MDCCGTEIHTSKYKHRRARTLSTVLDLKEYFIFKKRGRWSGLKQPCLVQKCVSCNEKEVLGYFFSWVLRKTNEKKKKSQEHFPRQPLVFKSVLAIELISVQFLYLISNQRPRSYIRSTAHKSFLTKVSNWFSVRELGQQRKGWTRCRQGREPYSSFVTGLHQYLYLSTENKITQMSRRGIKWEITLEQTFYT